MKTKKILAICLAVIAAAAAAFPAFAETIWETVAEEDKIGKETVLDIFPDDTIWFPVTPLADAGDLDKNGGIEPADARLALRAAIGLEPDLQNYCLYLADYDRDGRATPADARLILRRAVGIGGWPTVRQADESTPFHIRVNRYNSGDSYSDLGALIPLEENADAVKGYLTEDLPLWRITSPAELEAFAAAYKTLDADSYETGSLGVEAFLRRWQPDFFTDHELFIYNVVEGSGSNTQAIYKPERKDGKLTFRVGTASPGGGTCDIAEWFVFLPVEKNVTEGIASFACKRMAEKRLTEKENREARNNIALWMYAYNRILPEDAQKTLLPGTAFAFSLLNAQDGGYLWVYDDPPEGVTVQETYVGFPSDVPSAAGDSGLHLYTVSGDKPGTYTLRFRLKRAWETDHIAERTVTVTVKEGIAFSSLLRYHMGRIGCGCNKIGGSP